MCWFEMGGGGGAGGGAGRLEGRLNQHNLACDLAWYDSHYPCKHKHSSIFFLFSLWRNVSQFQLETEALPD